MKSTTTDIEPTRSCGALLSEPLDPAILDLHWEAAELLELAAVEREERRSRRREARLGALAAYLADTHPRNGLRSVRQCRTNDPLSTLAAALSDLGVRPTRALLGPDQRPALTA